MWQTIALSSDCSNETNYHIILNSPFKWDRSCAPESVFWCGGVRTNSYSELFVFINDVGLLELNYHFSDFL